MTKIGLNRVHLYLNVFCHSEFLGGGHNLMTMIVTSGVLWGSRKTLFRRFRCEGRGRDNHFREIGPKYPIFKGIYRENHKNDYCFFVTLI